MRPDTPREYIGVDVGSVRVGLARGSDLARIAEPVITVKAANAVQELSALAAKTGAIGIVVGLPRNLDGGDTAQTDYVRQWIKQAQESMQIPFYWQDEALTSVNAEQIKGKEAGPADAEAAALILQDFLDTPEEERLRC